MKSEIGTSLTIQDKRDKIRSQLYYELGLPETPRKPQNKLTGGVSKRAKFLKNPDNLKQKGEKPL